MSDERDIRHGAHDADDEDTAAVGRPSGKRSSRRARAGSASSDDTGAVATIDRGAGSGSESASRKASKSAGKKKSVEGGRGNPFKRLVKFLREVIAELRKVIWPNRKQMVTYTSVVLVFVVVLVAFISGLDLGLAKGIDWLFG